MLDFNLILLGLKIEVQLKIIFYKMQIRGSTKRLNSNNTNAEATEAIELFILLRMV